MESWQIIVIVVFLYLVYAIAYGPQLIIGQSPISIRQTKITGLITAFLVIAPIVFLIRIGVLSVISENIQIVLGIIWVLSLTGFAVLLGTKPSSRLHRALTYVLGLTVIISMIGIIALKS